MLIVTAAPAAAASAAQQRESDQAASSCGAYSVHVAPGTYKCMTTKEYNQYVAAKDAADAAVMPYVIGMFVGLVIVLSGMFIYFFWQEFRSRR